MARIRTSTIPPKVSERIHAPYAREHHGQVGQCDSGNGTGLSLNEVVHLSKLSAKTFVHRYQEAFGVNPSEEIQELRYQHCRNLLEEPDVSLADVAAQCGFSSQAAFSNYFQRHAQMTPSEYRARNKRRAS